jgi:hypothetical protein
MGTWIILLMAKARHSFKKGGLNVYEIGVFLKPVCRLMDSCVLRKVYFLKPHFISLFKKRYFHYI